MQPMNSYYQYPPANINPYGQPMVDQRQMRYMPINQPQQQINMTYQNNSYGQRMPIQNQWHGQAPVSPNKMSMQNGMNDYGTRPNNYGYNSNLPPNNYSQIPPVNYPQQPKFPPINQPIVIHNNPQPQIQPYQSQPPQYHQPTTAYHQQPQSQSLQQHQQQQIQLQQAQQQAHQQYFQQ